MAAFYAVLEVDGQTYPVLHCDYRFTQSTGALGQVNTKVHHGLLELVLDVPEDDNLMAWAAAPQHPLDGHVSFFSGTALMAHETVGFTAGECVSYTETYESGSEGIGAYQCHLTIAAAKLALSAGGPALAYVAPAAGNHGLPGMSGIVQGAAIVAQQKPHLENSIQDIIANGKKNSPKFAALLNAANITDANFAQNISLGTGTYTEIGQGAKIVLAKNSDIKRQVIELTHELTNRSKMATTLKAQLDVSKGLITPKDYAKKLAQIEVDGEINQVKVAADVGYRFNGKGTKAVNGLINDYSKNKKTNLTKKIIPATAHLNAYEKQGKDSRADYLKKNPLPALKKGPIPKK